MDDVSETKMKNAFASLSMSEDDYEHQFWPQVKDALYRLLILRPKEYASVSFEQVYSCVYKCVCNQFAERLLNDLRNYIRSYLMTICEKLREVHSTDLVRKFEEHINQYQRSIQHIALVFTYLNRFHVERNLQTDLHSLLLADFASIVVQPYIYPLIDMLKAAQVCPFTEAPSVMANVINGLYILKPEYAQLAPELFAAYIPNVLSPMCEEDIQQHVYEIRSIQERLAKEGYSRNSSPLKRPLENEASRDSAKFCN